MDTTNIIYKELEALSSEKRRETNMWFFKTGEDEYGAGDEFLGVNVPDTRSVAKQHLDVELSDIELLLNSPLHEMRLCGLIILVEKYKRTTSKSWLREYSFNESEAIRKQYFEFYLANTKGINNWDLVDLSAYNIVGEWLTDKPRDILYTLACSKNIWEQRIAIVSTYAFIKRGDLLDTLILGEKLLYHPHDLMRKAVGWMLREAGKRDKNTLITFLDTHVHHMPRTTLRYAIEKFDEQERQYYLRMKE